MELLKAAIFDVDGVLLASPHERAWREALTGLTDPGRFTTAIYQASVAGKPRMDGALAALKALGIPDPDGKVAAYAERKQAKLESLILEGHICAFPDALRLVADIAALGWPMAVASSSKNANDMLRQIHLPDGRTLFDMFAVHLCGLNLSHGKPDPEIFELAAKALNIKSAQCFVAEDAPVGIQAARAGGMIALGVARLDDQAGLQAAQANLVVTSLDAVDREALATGHLWRVAA